jgi:hypothetical protein
LIGVCCAINERVKRKCIGPYGSDRTVEERDAAGGFDAE